MAEKKTPAKPETKGKKSVQAEVTDLSTQGVDVSNVPKDLAVPEGTTSSKASMSKSDPVASGTEAISRERAWKIAQLAAVLASSGEIRESSHRLVNAGSRIASPSLDTFYAAALKRAETLLDWAEGRWGKMYAYQFFDEGKIYTETQILAVFSHTGWEDLSSKQPIINLMRQIRGEFKEQIRLHQSLDELGNGQVLLEFLHDLDASIDSTLEDWFGKHEHVTSYCESVRVEMREILKRCAEGVQTQLPKAAATEILDAINRHIKDDLPEGETDVRTVQNFVEELKMSFAGQTQSLFPSGSGLERIHAQLEREKFREWCFPQPPKKSRAERLYRAYEIFLHCAVNRWCDDRLIKNSGSLRIQSIPSPPIDLRSPNFEMFRQTFPE